MSQENARRSKSLPSEGSQTLSVWPTETLSELERHSPSGFWPSVPSGSTTNVAILPRRPPPGLPAPTGLAYLGTRRAEHFAESYARDIQHPGLDSAPTAAVAISRNDRTLGDERRTLNSVGGGLMITRPNLFSNIASIPDLLADVDRTLESVDPLQTGQEKYALSTGTPKLQDKKLNVNSSHSSQSSGGRAPDSFRQRGLSVADITLLNAAWEETDGVRGRHVGSSIVTLDSSSRIRREVKFDDELDARNLFRGASGSEEREESFADDDDQSIELEGGTDYRERLLAPDNENKIYYDYKTSDEEDARLQSDIAMAFPSNMVYDRLFLEPGLWPGEHDHPEMVAPSLRAVDASSTRKAAIGLAKELRRLSLAPEDLVIPSGAAANTEINPDLGLDMVGGLPGWEFKRAGLSRFVSAAEMGQQEALLEAYEQGLGPEALEESSQKEESVSDDTSHLFVFDRVQPRGAASALASGSGEGRAKVENTGEARAALHTEEALEDEKEIGEEEEEEEDNDNDNDDDDDEITLAEQEQIERAMVLSLEDLNQELIGKGKERAY